MGNVFAITTASDRISLDKRQGEVVFNVHNRTDRTIATLAQLEPIGDTKAEWLSLDGEVERQLSAGETKQYTARLAVPPDAPAGQYSFRLRVASVSRPNEDFEEGPVVAATVADSKPPPPPPPWGLIIGIIAAVLLLVGGFLVWYFIIRDGEVPKVVVPDVVGKQVQTATEEITGVGFTVVELATPLSGGVPAGQVTDQDPDGGAEADALSTVNLTVATASEVAVPDVQFKPLGVAQQVMTDIGLNAIQKDTAAEGGGVAPGQVSQQNPAAGQKVPQGSTVELTVAEALISVPDVRKLEVGPATVALRSAGLEIGSIRGAQTGAAITDQTPSAGSKVPKGSKVHVTVPGRPFVTLIDQVHIMKHHRVLGRIPREVPADLRPEDLTLKRVR